MELLTPLGLLVACAALVPVGAAIVRARRETRIGRALGLTPPRRSARLATAAAAALALGLLAAATARPAVRTEGTHSLRTDAQVFFVLDISRSMLARPAHGRTRYARAVDGALAIRSRLADFPVGLVSLTDRPLPHLFPSGDPQAFEAVLRRAVGIQRPPPESGKMAGVATNFDPLAQLASSGYFRPGTRRRLAILLTDGESDLYSADAVATQLKAEHVGLIIVRFWHRDERVYASNGRPEQYRPEPHSLLPLQVLAAQTGGRRVFEEGERKAIVAKARALLGHGPAVSVGQARHFELAPYFALAALLPLSFAVWRRDPRPPSV